MKLKVHMDTKVATEFRTKGVALARAKTEGFVGVYFGLCNTLGSRVRCEVRLVGKQNTFMLGYNQINSFIF